MPSAWCVPMITFLIVEPGIRLNTASASVPFEALVSARCVARESRAADLGLFVATPLQALVPLHAAVKDLAGKDVQGLLQHDGLVRHREPGDRVGEPGRWTRAEVGLRRVGVACAGLTPLVGGNLGGCGPQRDEQR